MTSRNHRKRCQSQNTRPTKPEKKTRADRRSHETGRTGVTLPMCCCRRCRCRRRCCLDCNRGHCALKCGSQNGGNARRRYEGTEFAVSAAAAAAGCTGHAAVTDPEDYGQDNGPPHAKQTPTLNTRRMRRGIQWDSSFDADAGDLAWEEAL